MGKIGACTSLVIAAIVFEGVVPGQAHAQFRSGSTVQGDRLRGEGVFLQGMGWYELNDAKAASMNAETMIKIDQWNKQIYDTYMRERSDRITAQKKLVEKSTKEAERKRAEREERLRTSPEPADIQKGDALNALLIDLSAPSIPHGAWRLTQVSLPDDLSIKELIFRFTPIFTDKRTQELARGLIALGRLNVKGDDWPPFLPAANVGAERRAYEAAYKNVCDTSLAGNLGLDEVRELDLAIDLLKAKANTAIPEYRNFRKEAVQYIEELRKATRMFNAATLSYAQEMIADTTKHRAGTVGELLAFMRKYSLMFGAADLIENGGQKYARLYLLLQQQKKKLEAKPAAGLADVPENADLFRTGSFWVKPNSGGAATFTVIERDGEDFKARFQVSRDITHEVTGKIKDNKIKWVDKDILVIKGNKEFMHGDYEGTITNDELSINRFVDGKPRGSFVVRLERK